MKKIQTITFIVLCLLNILVPISLLPSMPQQVPMQWDMNWQVSRYGSKYEILIIATIPMILLVIEILSQKNSKDKNYRIHKKNYSFILRATIVFLIALNGVTMYSAYNKTKDVSMLILIILGILMIVLGNYIPTIRSNYMVGIRNPWTLKNELVWKKTHRYGGYIFLILGFLFIATGLVQDSYLNIVGLISMVVGMVGINLYSFILYKKLVKK